MDLIRYCRAELQDAGLISDKEYADLVAMGKDSRERLEDYDSMRSRIRELEGRIADYESAGADVRRLTRQLDVEMHGEGAAPQASLCDLMGSGKKLRDRAELAERVVADLLDHWPGEWVYEDALPEMTKEQFDRAYQFSKVDGVRMYPAIQGIIVDSLEGEAEADGSS
jgi:hypothetical protein